MPDSAKNLPADEERLLGLRVGIVLAGDKGTDGDEGAKMTSIGGD